MSKLKNKIRQLEADIIMDRQIFSEQTNTFFESLGGFKENIYIISLIFAGLSFGYAMGHGKGGITARITSAAMFLMNTSQLANRLIP